MSGLCASQCGSGSRLGAVNLLAASSYRALCVVKVRCSRGEAFGVVRCRSDLPCSTSYSYCMNWTALVT